MAICLAFIVTSDVVEQAAAVVNGQAAKRREKEPEPRLRERTMAVIRGTWGQTAMANPGLYLVGARGLMPGGGPGSTAALSGGTKTQSDTAAAKGYAALLVSPLGDFVVSRLGAADSGRMTVNGRSPLGGLERLAEGDVIDVRGAEGFAGDRSGPVHFTYLQRIGPPIRFVMPALSSLRCCYCGKSLAGATAIRCSGCFLLFHEEAAWRSELDESCPWCGWRSRGGEQ